MAVLFKISPVAFLVLCLLFLTKLPSSHSFLEEDGDSANSYSNPKQFQQLIDQCATKNITVDPKVLDTVRECLAPIMEDVEKSGVATDTNKILPTICKHADAAKKCYRILTDVMEECYSELFANEVVFKMSEILDNAQKAFCAQRHENRVNKALTDKMAQLSVFSCAVSHYAVVLQDLMECPALAAVFDNPLVFQHYPSDQICGEVDKIEKCLVSTLDLCKNSEVVVTYVKNVFDIFIGIIFRCPSHKNF